MREVGSGRIYTTRAESGCTLAVMAINGRNQNASGSDPACLAISIVMDVSHRMDMLLTVTVQKVCSTFGQ